MSDTEMTMTVSPICLKDDKKIAYVSFEDGKRRAEGVIPDCILKNSEGFSAEEKEALEVYMKANLTMLKKMASSNNVLGAMMGERENK